ncbi:hypothetical protein [Luteithermobacter gelatinilyticus]|uniref:hypothetical protein n=1 Tax=Luteithermobacter gelatinilyticus TaxID=2582913 RepID=UPI001AEFF770|nr:hypothetical protein [Luteithermobacter gelatinilyticus]
MILALVTLNMMILNMMILATGHVIHGHSRMGRCWHRRRQLSKNHSDNEKKKAFSLLPDHMSYPRKHIGIFGRLAGRRQAANALRQKKLLFQYFYKGWGLFFRINKASLKCHESILL